MRKGAWHQLGAISQCLVEEQLQKGVGVGAILSPRDLPFQSAAEYAEKYRDLGAEVLIDQQFYIPHFSNPKLESYPISKFRTEVPALHQISDEQLTDLAYELEEINKKIKSSAIIAPAVVYEANRPDIAKLNKKLFTVSKLVGDKLGVPTYATAVFGVSVTASTKTITPALSQATSLNPDGWYFGFEFDDGRILSSQEGVKRLLLAGLTLTCTGKPVLHAFAGPMALLSFCFGAVGAGIGHSQNLWQFSKERFEPSTDQGGGGGAPARFFSSSLWGTIVHPDELILLSRDLKKKILTHSEFSIEPSKTILWNRWDANKHLVNLICLKIQDISQKSSVISTCKEVTKLLKAADRLHADIAAEGIAVKDFANAYQNNWKLAIESYLDTQGDEIEYLSMLTVS